MTVACLVCMAIACWAIMFEAYYAAFIACIGFMAFLPVLWNRKNAWFARATVFVIGIVLASTTFRLPIMEINNRISHLAGTPRANGILSAFSMRDKLGIYGLNIIMGVLAYPIYPEASKETLMMMFKISKGGVRTFASDFAINSKVVRAELKKIAVKIIEAKGTEEVNLKKRISWNVSDYTLGNREARYALALNSSDLSLIARQRDSKWNIEVSLLVEIRYSMNSYVTLLANPALRIEEGLYWVLQQAGWLFPYRAEWKFTIDSNDESIR